MKKLILAVVIFICCIAHSQETKPQPQGKDTTINNSTIKVFTGSKGGKYILVTSKNGNVYKKYLTKKN